MNPEQTPAPTLPAADRNPLSVMQPDEQVVCEIKRSPVGLFGAYFSVGVIIVAVFAIALIVPHYVSGLSSSSQAGLWFGALLIAILAGLYLLVVVKIYKNNRWIVTTDSITEVLQVGLFRKQNSQMGLGELEDVTVQQNGVLQAMFHFGTLHAESAGERSKFIFPFCPDPNDVAKKVLNAREQFETGRRDELRTPYGLHDRDQSVAASNSYNPELPNSPPASQPPTSP